MADDGNDPGDEYERRYMSGGDEGAVLLRDKHVSRGLAGLLLVLAALLLGLGGALLADVDPSAPRGVAFVPLIAGVLVALAGLTMGVVRTVVSEHAVRVQLGLWGPRVALSSLCECGVVDYEPSKFGGWGIRRAFDGTWAYTTPDTRKVLSLAWQDDKGKVHMAVASVADPEAVVAAVRRAQQMAVSRRGARKVVERLAGGGEGEGGSGGERG